MALHDNPVVRHGIASLVFAAVLQAQAPPQFEAASVRPIPPGVTNPSSGITSKPGRIMANNVTLKRCIMGAYAIGQNEIQGGPEWLDTDRFDIVATAAGPANDAELMQMLRTLMAERFKLTTHHEPRSIPVYVLEAGKGPPKLSKSEAATEGKTNSRQGMLDGRAMSLPKLAQVLGRFTDRPVIDRTGIEGAYDIHLEWTPDDPRSVANKSPDAAPSLFAAVAQQLGLRLEPQKAPVDILVIDRAERPTDN